MYRNYKIQMEKIGCELVETGRFIDINVAIPTPPIEGALTL
jgi:hypothetical protein